MKRKIFKYELSSAFAQEISMPQDAEIISVQLQRNMPCIWAIIDPEEKLVKRKFVTIGTGREFDGARNLIYRGTDQQDDYFGWHVFEEQ